MIKKRKKVALFAMALIGTLVISAYADCRRQISLAATTEGAAIQAGGRAEVRQQRARQHFKVQVEANVPDGTTFTVYGNDALAGTLTFALGRGELDLQTDDGRSLPPGLDPVCGLSTVDVVDEGGTLILHGDF